MLVWTPAIGISGRRGSSGLPFTFFPRELNMKRYVYAIAVLLIFSGCAELDKAGDAVLREVRSINEGTEASYEAIGGPPPEAGEAIAPEKHSTGN